jgi:orotate phosphoribosyltransferase
MERGQGYLSALDEIREQYGFATHAIVTIAEVVEYLHNTPLAGKIHLDDDMKQAFIQYQEQYGVQNP